MADHYLASTVRLPVSADELQPLAAALYMSWVNGNKAHVREQYYRVHAYQRAYVLYTMIRLMQSEPEAVDQRTAAFIEYVCEWPE